jgi:hypothetical protein
MVNRTVAFRSVVSVVRIFMQQGAVRGAWSEFRRRFVTLVTSRA